MSNTILYGLNNEEIGTSVFTEKPCMKLRIDGFPNLGKIMATFRKAAKDAMIGRENGQNGLHCSK